MNKKYPTYIIGVSGGPDSMALLDYMRAKAKVIVVHVNYHKRDTAMRDQNIVENYCVKHQIKAYYFDYENDQQGNFQELARKYRYNKFSEVYDLEEADGLMSAHHQDDLLETYLMQLKRGSIPSFWGMKEIQQWGKYTIIRPLLNKRKKDLIEYLENHDIAYGIDESNLTNDYQRNKIRHEIIELLEDHERNQLLQEITEKNNQREKLETKLSSLINNNRIKISDFVLHPQANILLRKLMDIEVSEHYITELIRQINDCDTLKVEIKEYWLLKENGWIRFVRKPESYHYIIEKPCLMNETYFKIVKQADSFNCATVSEDDYPLTIRNFSKGDKIKMNYGTKRISRWFIDHKIGMYERETWPIVLNRHQEVVMVSQIGCSLKHYSNNPNLFVIK